MTTPPPLPPLAATGGLALTEPELEAWGRALGAAATAPLVVALRGELGTGKTTLSRAICAGYGVTDPVTSPTFTLVHEYAGGPTPVLHLDLYRLRGPDDLHALGWDEIVSRHALVLVEWAERAEGELPHGHLPIELAHSPADPSRRILYAGGHT
jgi:tRNA threonylcarbamoyladenosine biosynthesis protein TsaE